jgi:hypothetical protein
MGFHAAPETEDPLENDRRTIMNIQSKTRYLSSLVLVLPLLHGQASAAHGFQERQLLAPSAAQQRIEQQGRVYIYDGLHEDTVDRALDTQFDRVQNMMFVGIRHTTDDGEEYADDGCD